MIGVRAYGNDRKKTSAAAKFHGDEKIVGNVLEASVGEKAFWGW
jgi:hypothetical protein